MEAQAPTPNDLARYLKDRRSQMDPAAFGFPSGRRRTPGLRREEIAQRAHISPAWYTWLEQGRGGAPSADVLDRIARAMMLTNAEREHLFLLGLGRLPDVRYQGDEGITPRLQRVLDVLDPCPAFIRSVTWDVVAWNRGATVLYGDFSRMAPDRRNIIRSVFLDASARAAHSNWEGLARFVVGAFKMGAARAGATDRIKPFVDDVSSLSSEFAALWVEPGVSAIPEATKKIDHPVLGLLEMEFSTFAVDGRPDLSIVLMNPVKQEDVGRIGSLISSGV